MRKGVKKKFWQFLEINSETPLTQGAGLYESYGMSSIIRISNDNFEAEVLGSPIPVLLDFWSPGCVPCMMIAPFLDAFAEQYAGRIKIAKANADEETALAKRFMVASVPTLLVFKDGAVFRKRVGALPKTYLEELFKDII